jgi:hypothetical protein
MDGRIANDRIVTDRRHTTSNLYVMGKTWPNVSTKPQFFDAGHGACAIVVLLITTSSRSIGVSPYIALVFDLGPGNDKECHRLSTTTTTTTSPGGPEKRPSFLLGRKSRTNNVPMSSAVSVHRLRITRSPDRRKLDDSGSSFFLGQSPSFLLMILTDVFFH